MASLASEIAVTAQRPVHVGGGGRSQCQSAPSLSSTMPPKTASSSAPSNSVQSLLKSYNDTTSPRLKLIDTFLLFLMLSGIIQFVYCILVTNFPFNAFLAG